MTEIAEDLLSRAASAISSADALLVTAGAGMGVDSGLPDFRGDTGFWKAYPPLQTLGVSFVDMANPAWFTRDPELAWGFYGHRLNLYRKTAPHAGFQILKRWGEAAECGVFVFTSNVDGQFQKAGFDDDTMYECHGSIHHLQCSRPCSHAIWIADDAEVDVDEKVFRARSPLPRCQQCGSVARPNVLMFGDWGWVPIRSQEQDERFGQWLETIHSARMVVVELGAGSAVPTVRLTSERIVASHGGSLVRINPREPQVPRDQVGISAAALHTLREIDRRCDLPG